jgi:hypothetical protein
MGGIDDDVVQHARRSAQRHIIVSLDTRVGIAKHLTVPLGDQDDDVRLIELRPKEPSVLVRGPRRWREEALWVEVVVRADEECAESADGREVCRHCGADYQRSTIDICFSL